MAAFKTLNCGKRSGGMEITSEMRINNARIPLRLDDGFVNAHQSLIIALRRVLGFIFEASGSSHGLHFLRMIPSPLDLCGQIFGIAWIKLQSCSPVGNN